jgi:geranylgeranyl transferase type-2 subunit beta
MSYQTDLMLRLVAGAAAIPEEERQRHAAYLAAAQRSDGGFPGRRGPSDLYYTGFALRGLALLGELAGNAAQRAADYLKACCESLPSPVSRLRDDGRGESSLPAADAVSLVTSAMLVELAIGRDVLAEAACDRRQAVVESFERFRRGDGGYAKTHRSGSSSTYQTFLVVLCRELAGVPLEGAERMIELVRGRQRGDGGFVEIDAMQQSGTNPTAAALGLLRIVGGLDDGVRMSAASFLSGMQTAEGGLRAHARLPVADLLSTFTGLVALADLEALGAGGIPEGDSPIFAERKLGQSPTLLAIDCPAARRFVRSLAVEGGGFRAGAFEQVVDVEYTFYGLGALAVLAEG